MLPDTDDDATLRQLYMLPVGFSWESKPGVTLIGDAAHLMTPFAGVGVNVALTDALELSRCLENVAVRETDSDGLGSDKVLVRCDIGDVTGALQEYESRMFVRASEAAQETYDSKQTLFAEDAEDKMVGMMKMMFAQE